MVAISVAVFGLAVTPLTAFHLPVLASPRTSVPHVTRTRLHKTALSMMSETAPEDTLEEAPEPMRAQGGAMFEEKVDMPSDSATAGKGKINNMFNENGVAYAPWMVDSLADGATIAAQERARRDKRAAESNTIFGDVQAQEMAGTGLKYKLVDGEVEVNWSTGDETDNEGFLVQKRRAGAAAWETISSYESYQPLCTKGIQGGVYDFVDPTSEPGSWYYRIMDCDDTGKQDFVCQALVEVQTKEEKFGTLFAVGIIGLVLTAATVVGVSMDPQ